MQTTNDVTVTGYLAANNLQMSTDTTGRQICSGYISLLCKDNNRVTVNFYQSQFNKDGKPNSKFNDLVNLMNTGVVHDENQTGSIVRASRCQISSYYNTRTGSMSDNIRGSFIRILPNAKPEEMIATFNFTGRVKGIVDEVKNDEVTGRVCIRLVGINYRGDANSIEFVVGAEFAQALKTVYSVGQTVALNGEIINKMEAAQAKVVPAAFGVMSVSSSPTFIREYQAYGGSPALTEVDAEYISDETLAQAEQLANQFVEEAKAKASQQQSQATPTMNMYNNVANNFANAVNNNPFNSAGNLPPMGDFNMAGGYRF